MQRHGTFGGGYLLGIPAYEVNLSSASTTTILADGSGKAGLTFLTTSTGIWSPMNAIDTNAGGWEKSELRQKMNSGKIWNLMPSDFQSEGEEPSRSSRTTSSGTRTRMPP